MHSKHSWGGGGCASPQISPISQIQPQAALGSKPGFLPWEMTAPRRSPAQPQSGDSLPCGVHVQLLLSTAGTPRPREEAFPLQLRGHILTQFPGVQIVEQTAQGFPGRDPPAEAVQTLSVGPGSAPAGAVTGRGPPAQLAGTGRMQPVGEARRRGALPGGRRRRRIPAFLNASPAAR